MTPDDVLAELLRIRSRQEAIDPESPEYAALDARRNELRTLARWASDHSRDRASLEAELRHLEKRLSELDGYTVEIPEWQQSMGKYTINEPGAHMSKINDAITDNYEDERTTIESRIAEIAKTLAE